MTAKTGAVEAWWRSATIYEIALISFQDSDGCAAGREDQEGTSDAPAHEPVRRSTARHDKDRHAAEKGDAQTNNHDHFPRSRGAMCMGISSNTGELPLTTIMKNHTHDYNSSNTARPCRMDAARGWELCWPKRRRSSHRPRQRPAPARLKTSSSCSASDRRSSRVVSR